MPTPDLTPLLHLAVEMPPTISNKRRRTDSDNPPTVARSTIQRDATDIRNSLQGLYDMLPRLGDITVSVQLSNEHEAQTFPCFSALLASASRPLAAMLFGPMADASGGLDQPRHLRILRLSGTEPWCFEQMLSFIHGHHLGEPRPPLIVLRRALPPSSPPSSPPNLPLSTPLSTPLSDPLSIPRPNPPSRPPACRRRPSTCSPYTVRGPSQPRHPSPCRAPSRAATALTIDTAVQLHHVADYYEVCLVGSRHRLA